MKLPEGSTAVTGLEMTGQAQTFALEDGTVMTSWPNAKGYDLPGSRMIGAYGDIIDNTAPSLTASLSEATLTAAVTDAVDGVLAKDSITVTYDGKTQSFTYDAAAGRLTAAVPAPDGAAPPAHGCCRGCQRQPGPEVH